MRSGVRAFGSGARAWLLAVGGFTLSGFSLLELLDSSIRRGLHARVAFDSLSLLGTSR